MNSILSSLVLNSFILVFDLLSTFYFHFVCKVVHTNFWLHKSNFKTASSSFSWHHSITSFSTFFSNNLQSIKWSPQLSSCAQEYCTNQLETALWEKKPSKHYWFYKMGVADKVWGDYPVYYKQPVRVCWLSFFWSENDQKCVFSKVSTHQPDIDEHVWYTAQNV